MQNLSPLAQIERDSKDFFHSLTEIEKILENFGNKDLSEDKIVQYVEGWNRSYQKLIRALIRRKKQLVQGQESKIAK